MNRRPPGLKLVKAIYGFLQHKAAEALSPRTLEGYEHDLNTWLSQVGDVDIGSITTQDLRSYLAWLRTDYKPRRVSGSDHPLAAKTLRNRWVTLAAFFTWASTEIGIANPMKAIPAPRFEEAPVEPFTREEIEALLKACEFCHEAKTIDRRRFTMRRSTGKRDRALILTLLDTGLRASELCALTIEDVDQKTGHVEVKHGVTGGAKGGKGPGGLPGQGHSTCAVALPDLARGWRGSRSARIHRQVLPAAEPEFAAAGDCQSRRTSAGEALPSASFSPYFRDYVFAQRRRFVD